MKLESNMKLKTLTTALVLAAALAPASVFASKNHDSHMNHDQMHDVVEPIQSKGVVTAVNPAKQKITLNHEPIPELGWPQMIMGFSVAPDVDLSGLSKGDKVTFSMVPEGKSQKVTSIKKQ